MGSCFSIMGDTKRRGTEKEKTEDGTRHRSAELAFAEEEELVVKEVLSETPNPFLSTTSASIVSSAAGDGAGLDTKQQKHLSYCSKDGVKNDDVKNESTITTSADVEELDGSVEMCPSMSETVSAVSTFTERDGAETEEDENCSFNRKERRRVHRSSPSSSLMSSKYNNTQHSRRCADDSKHRPRSRTGTLSGEIPNNKPPRSRRELGSFDTANSRVSRGRPSPSPSRTRKGATTAGHDQCQGEGNGAAPARSNSRVPKRLNSGGVDGVGRVGTQSTTTTTSSADKKQYRRSVSPAPKRKTSGDGRSNLVIGAGGGEKASNSVDRVAQEQVEEDGDGDASSKAEKGKRITAAEEEDSLDNPLVSLECFIFL